MVASDLKTAEVLLYAVSRIAVMHIVEFVPTHE
jgi:hypothetical protein